MIRRVSHVQRREQESGVFLALGALVLALAAGALIILGYRTYIARRTNLVLKTLTDVICSELTSDKGAEEQNAAFLVHPTLPASLPVRFVNSLRQETTEPYFVRSNIEILEAHLIAPTFNDANKGNFEFGVTPNFPYANDAGVTFACPSPTRCFMHTDPDYISNAGSDFSTRVRNLAQPGGLGTTSALAGNAVFCEVRARSTAPFGPTQEFRARAGWANPVRSHVFSGSGLDMLNSANYKMGLKIVIDPTITSAFQGYSIGGSYGTDADLTVEDADINMTGFLTSAAETEARHCEDGSPPCPASCDPPTGDQCDGSLSAAESAARTARYNAAFVAEKAAQSPGLYSIEDGNRRSQMADNSHFIPQINPGFTYPWSHFWFSGTASAQDPIGNGTYGGAFAKDEPAYPGLATLPFGWNFRWQNPDSPGYYYIEPEWRQSLITGCMNPYLLMRNMYLATIVGQAMRHGALRYQTEVLVMQPRRITTCTAADPGGCRNSERSDVLGSIQNPPAVLIPDGSDLNSRSFRFPVVDFGMNVYDNSNPTDIQKLSDLSDKHWYYSLMAQQLRLCYSLYSSAQGIATYDVDRVNFFGTTADKILQPTFGVMGNLALRQPTAGYADWGNGTGFPLTDGNPFAVPSGLLTGIEAVSMLGSVQRCPVQISKDNEAMPNTTYGENLFSPSIASCVKPSLGGGSTIGSFSANLYKDLRADITDTLRYLRDAGGDSHILLILTRGVTGADVNSIKMLVNEIQCGVAGSTAKNACIGHVDSATGLRTHRPITIIYMPTRSVDSDGATGTELESLMNAFFIDSQAGATGNAIYMMSPFIERYKGLGLLYSPDNAATTRLDKLNYFWTMTYGARAPAIRSAFLHFQRRVLGRSPIY